MAKATETKLAELHGEVAETLTILVNAPLYDKEGNAIEGTERKGATPAALSVAVAFLKNNNITADSEVNEGLSKLRKTLADKRQASKAGMMTRANAIVDDLSDRLRMPGEDSIQ